MSIQKLLENSCERTETKYNMVVHRKLWRKGAAAVEFGDGIANCCFIISVKTIFQTFFVQKFKKTFFKASSKFYLGKGSFFSSPFSSAQNNWKFCWKSVSLLKLVHVNAHSTLYVGITSSSERHVLLHVIAGHHNSLTIPTTRNTFVMQ